MADAMEWTHPVPVLGNPVLLRQMAIVFGLAPLPPLALIALAVVPEGDAGTLLPLAGMLFGISAALGAVGLLVAALLWRNRVLTRFRLTAEGFSVETVDSRARATATAAAVLGAASGNLAAAGAGRLAAASSDLAARWTGVSSARFHPRLGAIELRNDWRTVAVLFAPPGLFETARAHVLARLPKRPKRRRSPPLRGLLWSAGVVLAVLPCFFAPEVLGTDLLPAMVLAAFAVATVWLLPALGWAMIGSVLWMLGSIGLAAVGPRGWSFGTGDGIALLALMLAGLGLLIWFAIRTIRGRFVPVLLGDLAALGAE